MFCKISEYKFVWYVIVCVYVCIIDQQDCISLDSIGRNLTEGVESHQANCQSRPHFSVMKQMGVDNMLMTCEVRVDPWYSFIYVYLNLIATFSFTVTK